MDLLIHIIALANGATFVLLIWTWLTLRDLDKELQDLTERTKKWRKPC